MRIGIVGGGAAGMFCALSLDCKKHQITVLEKNADTLKKLLITGHGRCNVTNLKSSSQFLENVPHNGQFLFSALNMFSPEDMVEFLNNNKIVIQTQGKKTKSCLLLIIGRRLIEC